LALMVAVAVMIAIGVAPQPGRRPDALAYVLGLSIAALVPIRRRWPVVVLVASAAALQVYYLLDYAGIRPAVPLAVALATAWAAGHPHWSLLAAAWFAGAPLLFRTLVEEEPLRRVLNKGVRDAPCTGAVSRSRAWFRPCLPAGMEHRGRAVSAMLVSAVDPDGRRQRVGG